MLRVAELIRHAMAELLTRGGIQDPVLETNIITVPRVKMSPDLKLATVYVLPLGGKDAKVVIDALEKHRKYLRGEIARKINLKTSPDIRFRADDSFDNAAEIDKLFRTDKVRQDIAQDAAHDGEAEDGHEADDHSEPRS